jgi:hypothetical protein
MYCHLLWSLSTFFLSRFPSLSLFLVTGFAFYPWRSPLTLPHTHRTLSFFDVKDESPCLYSSFESIVCWPDPPLFKSTHNNNLNHCVDVADGACG